MKKVIKILTFTFLALCLTLGMQAQILESADRSVKVDKSKDKQAKLEKRAHKMADRLEMTEDQRARFVPAQVDFHQQIRDIRHSKVEKTERKAQAKALAGEHKAYLSSFLSEDQMAKMKQFKKQRKHKRKHKKNRKGKKKGVEKKSQS